jgi:hypothetical protein
MARDKGVWYQAASSTPSQEAGGATGCALVVETLCRGTAHAATHAGGLLRKLVAPSWCEAQLQHTPHAPHCCIRS